MIALLAAVLLQETSTVVREVEVANSKERPLLQGQAVRRLQARGGPAVAAEIEAFVAARGRAALSTSFVAGLAVLKDPRLTKLLRALAEDRDFFWRPAAVASLAEHADPTCRDFFRDALADRLWGVRAAAILGLEKLGDKDATPAIRERLGDDVYDVRAQAAKTLHAFGDPSGLPVLVEALRANTVWFDIDYGQIAREDAWNFLRKLAGGDFGFKPWETVEERAPGLAKFEAWLATSMPDWRDRLPEKARVKAEKVDYVFGFELRSCQKGDVFFRVDADGTLVLGYFNLEKAKLDADELKSMTDAIAKAKRVDRTVPYGEGGCDFEQYYLKEGTRFEKLWIGLRGRPAAVEPFVKVAHGLLRKKFGEAVAAEFKERTALFQSPE